jgi:hypothetical protein
VVDQTGIGAPRARFMVQPPPVGITMVIAGSVISSGVCKSPRLTISQDLSLAAGDEEERQNAFRSAGGRLRECVGGQLLTAS